MTTAAIDPKRRALGKGLDSLLPRVQAPAASADAEGGKPREIPLDQIDRNPFQTRSNLNEEQLAELAASITANGVVQPMLVRPLPNGRFQLIAGERRWRASSLPARPLSPPSCARSPTSRRWKSPSSKTSSAPTSTPWSRPEPSNASPANST